MEKALKILKEIRERNSTKMSLFDITTPEFYRKFCEEYSEAVTPKVEATQRDIAKSMEDAFKVVRY